MDTQAVDVIIPVYKPKKEFLKLIEKLERQTVPVNRIIIMNTEEKYFERLIYGTDFKRRYSNVEIYHISEKEFDHGNTRNKGVRRSKAPYFICMTHDAMPFDEHLVEYLLKAFDDEKVAVAYARQLPAEDCSPIERFTREFNYPAQPAVKSGEDIPRLGIKTFFCSNACAAYRRDVFEERGGFVRHTIFNEDMIYAAGAVKAGWKISYAAQAQVVHSHNYTGKEDFRRNFDLGVSQADHPEIFRELPSESEGVRLVLRTRDYLKEQGKRNQIPRLYWKSACKLMGYKLGKSYRRLPVRLRVMCSMNRKYWYTLSER